MEEAKARLGVLVVDIVDAHDAYHTLDNAGAYKHVHWTWFGNAPRFALQWSSPDTGTWSARMLRIVTPLDDRGRIHGRETYLSLSGKIDGFIEFEEGHVTSIDGLYWDFSLSLNVMHTLGHMHEINTLASVLRDRYADRTCIADRTLARFLLACHADGMRALPFELRREILLWLLPPPLLPEKSSRAGHLWQRESGILEDWCIHC